MGRDQPLHLVKQMNIDPTPPANNKQGLKTNLHTLFNQSAAKTKPIASWSQAFTRAGRRVL